MKKCFITVVLAMAAVVAYAGNPKPAYNVFDGKGRKTDYTKMLDNLSEADVVFIG